MTLRFRILLADLRIRFWTFVARALISMIPDPREQARLNLRLAHYCRSADDPGVYPERSEWDADARKIQQAIEQEITAADEIEAQRELLADEARRLRVYVEFLERLP